MVGDFNGLGRGITHYKDVGLPWVADRDGELVAWLNPSTSAGAVMRINAYDENGKDMGQICALATVAGYPATMSFPVVKGCEYTRSYISGQKETKLTLFYKL